MNSNRAILRINDSEYNILELNYRFHRSTDAKGRPTTGVRGGEIHVLIESERDNYLLRQMLNKECPPVNGSIEISRGEESQCFRSIEFETAYIYSQAEALVAHSPIPMLTTISITPLRMDINRKVRLDRSWPETYGFWWEEYKPQQRNYTKLASSEEIPKVLITQVEGQKTALPNSEMEYKVTNYNVSQISDYNKACIKWIVEVDGKRYKQSQKGDKVKLRALEEWSGKEIMVMPYLEKCTPRVCVKTKIKKWTFPVIIDRYKMPGLNATGSDVADDMTYGYGIKMPRPFLSKTEIEEYIDLYKQEGFDENKHGYLCNKFEGVKSIYSKDDLPKLVSGVKDYLKSLLPHKVVEKVIKDISDLFKDEEETRKDLEKRLFADFRDMVKTLFTSSDNKEMQNNILQMIDKFERNEGGIYENDILTKHIKEHPSTLRYCRELESYMCNILKEHKGDVSKLQDDIIYWTDKNSPKETKKQRAQDYGKPFSLTPVYAGDAPIPFGTNPEKVRNAREGYTIALNDIWATEIIITDYELNDKNFKVTYQVTLWDHFGLDLPDIQAKKMAGWLDGFMAWFILQHIMGYRPFITKITFTKEFQSEL